MKSLCVFCGSRSGNDPAHARAAERLGVELAERNITLVYGGGRVGLMGVVAHAVLGAAGEAVGVMPKALIEREIGHTGLTDLRVVGSMHERKALMAELAQGFVALPGGTGTLEEFFEVLTWAQLGIHAKPCGLLNVAGYYDLLLDVFERMVDRGFLSEAHRAMVLVETGPRALLERFAHYQPPKTAKWLDRSEI